MIRVILLFPRYELPYHPAMGQIVSLLFFYKYSFGIEYPTNIDMPLNNETEAEVNNIWEVK